MVQSGQTHEDILRAVVKKHKLQKSICHAVLQPAQYNLLQVEAPDVPPEELKSAVRWRIKDIIDFHIDDAVIDVFEVPQQRNQRMKLLYVVVSKKSHIENHAQLLTAAGVTLDVIDIPELVLRNVGTLLAGKRARVSSSTLYLGGSGGKILICKSGVLMISRSIDVATEKLAGAPEYAGTDSLPDEVLDELDTIVLELQRSMDYYDSNWTGSQVDLTLVLPMEHDVPALLPHAYNTLGGNIKMADFNDAFTLPRTLSHPEQAKLLFSIGASLRQHPILTRLTQDKAAQAA